ncbi:peroxisomal biogenesis factor 11 [Gaertneriomyces semiglobifer]|nr:peroxisomal biogenesis factor 11 [Gaertneriomyces semiglobifer]
MRPNATLDKLVRFLSSVRGTDKVLMFVQYFTKFLAKTARNPVTGQKFANLSSPISDTRILLRYYGLIPMLQWSLYSESHPHPNAKIALLTRFQNIANYCYYPLEHIYWLAAHKVISLKDATVAKIGVWSCRFWAAYVVLYFLQLWEERKDMLLKKRRILSRRAELLSGDKGERAEFAKELEAEERQLREENSSWTKNVIVNAAYFPLTVHWSLYTSTFPEWAVGVCGTVAAVVQINQAWKSA